MTEIVHDQAQKLARMAGQIATFFKAYPRDEAVQSLAEHINQFWSKRMREEFLAAYAPGDPRLDPLVAAALPLIRGRKAA